MADTNFYITTTLPYVNSDPHLGFALEMVQADAIARYHREVLGQEVFFNTGTDEHGLKIFQKAQAEGKETQAYVDEYAAKFGKLKEALNLSYNNFIRTTDEHHILAAQEFWKLCKERGYITEKQKYEIKYCVGCELEKTESDLNETGHCLVHPHLELEIREEENYFFKFESLQKNLEDLYKKYPDFVVPEFRLNEIKELLKSGLKNFSISRLKSKMPWGIEVPGDPDQVMYVWFDALVNYVSALGWPNNKEQFEKFWGTAENPKAVQIAGKDNLRQQSAMWQAMLIAAGLPTSRQIIIHGFINSGGQKMSKSLGNVADPYDILAKLKSKGLDDSQATDALRYYLLREISTFEDGDYTWEHFVETYNAGLANGIGNLTSRILKMATSNGVTHISPIRSNQPNKLLDSDELQKAIDEVWKKIAECDGFIQKEEPFKVIKTNPEKAKKDIQNLLENLNLIAFSLTPFLPETSEKILEALKNPSAENIPRLFPRIE